MREKYFRGSARSGGVALVVVMVFTLLLLTLGATFLRLATSERISIYRNIQLNQVFYLAEAGVERGIVYLESLNSPPTGINSFYPFGEEEIPLLGVGTYDVIIDPDDANPGSGIKKYDIISVGRINNPEVIITKSVTVKVSQESFAKYAYFTNQEVHPTYGTIWFFTTDTLEGPVHSNSQIHIYGSPLFQGIVTSTATSFDYYPGVMSNPIFEEGYELGVSPIDMDKYKNLQQLESLAITGGLKLNSDSRVELNSNGTLTYRLRTGGTWSSPVWGSPVTLALPANGMLYIDGNAMVSGTLNGRLTIVVENSMEIPSDITYADPPTSPQCNDVLGLIAGSKIEVTKSSPSGSNLEIDGVLMAFDQSFGVRNFRTIPVMGQLIVWGGIIQNYRGPVGTFNPYTGKQASGFSKDYHYDSRLVDNPPPHFPTTGKYKQDSWEEEAAVWG